jgi:hypothetical protein
MTNSDPGTGLPAQPDRPLAQAVQAAKLGLRDGVRPGLLGFSILTALGAFFLWFILFALGHGVVWAYAMKATHWVLPGLSTAPTSIGQASMWVWVAQAFSGLLAFLISVAAFGLFVMLTIQLVLEFFLMPRIHALCLPQYPTLRRVGGGSLSNSLITLAKLWGVLVAGMLLWVIPVVGGLAFFALAGYLNVRILANDALEGVATPEELRAIAKSHRWGMLCLGVMMGVFLMIPLAGLVAPSVLGASVCHFCFAALVKLRQRRLVVTEA